MLISVDLVFKGVYPWAETPFSATFKGHFEALNCEEIPFAL